MGVDWSHIGSGILLVLLFLITLPFLGEVEHEHGASVQTVLVRSNGTLETEKLVEVIDTEIRIESLPQKKLQNDPDVQTIQMERPKKPSWIELKSAIRREAVPDPRFAAPEGPLICTLNRKPQINFQRREDKAIGCCPADDADGTPYGPGKACCCGRIYVDDGSKFCCEDNCSVYDNTEINRLNCNDDRSLFDEITTTESTTSSTVSTTTTSTKTTTTSTTSTTTSTTIVTTTTTSTTTPTTTTTQPVTNESQRSGSCKKLYTKKPQKLEWECDADRKDGSKCNFSCPEPLRLNGTDESTCHSGEWSIAPPSCCIRSGCPDDFKLDLYLVVDASSSIGEENFALVRRFIKSLSDFFEIGQDKVRIGLLSFNRKVSRILQLSDVENKADLDSAVDAIPYNGKGTNTGKALQEVVDNAFRQENGDRGDVENQVVVITDGKSKDDIKTPGRALKKMAHVMAIGVGVKVRTKDLFEIASSDEYVYTPESYSELGKLKFEVADKYCPPGCI